MPATHCTGSLKIAPMAQAARVRSLAHLGFDACLSVSGWGLRPLSTHCGHSISAVIQARLNVERIDHVHRNRRSYPDPAAALSPRLPRLAFPKVVGRGVLGPTAPRPGGYLRPIQCPPSIAGARSCGIKSLQVEGPPAYCGSCVSSEIWVRIPSLPGTQRKCLNRLWEQGPKDVSLVVQSHD
jgi:hypothetical protein